MKRKEAYQWAQRGEKRKSVLLSLKQPMTALQLSKKTEFNQEQCSTILGQLTLCGLVKCLNPTATRSRLYWLTPIGILCQKKLGKDKTRPDMEEYFPDIDWELYGWVCYNHRAAIIRILTEPMQPSDMKRKLRNSKSDMKISANNIRDVIKLFLQKGIVQNTFVRKKAHPRYELTELGTKVRGLLSRAEMQLCSISK